MEEVARRAPPSRSTLVDEIVEALSGYPALHLYREDRGIEVRGTYPVVGNDGNVLDEFLVSIEVPPTFSTDLPVVRETAGRLPRTVEHHVNADGTCCVILPDARWKSFPEGSSFRDYLNGPLQDFFRGQTLVEVGEPWPHGEWGHGAEGIREHYEELFETRDRATIRRYLDILGWPNGRRRPICPCGSQKRLRKCHRDRVAELRRKIPARIARRAFVELGFHRRRHRRGRR